MYKLALITTIFVASIIAPVFADAVNDFEAVRTEIWQELTTPLSAQDVTALGARRQRLRTLFHAVPAPFAAEFHDELGSHNNGGEFSDVLHGELSTAVRQELLAILQEKMAVGDLSVPAEDDFEAVRTEIWQELATPLSAQDVTALGARRQRLRTLFHAVPAPFAAEFHDELGSHNNGGEFSEALHGELSTVVRQELLAILQEKMAAPELSVQPPGTRPALSLRGNERLPEEWEPDFQSALLDMDAALPHLTSVPSSRMACVLDLLRNPAVDDRVAFWTDVCPDEGHNIQLLSGGCPVSGLKPDAQRLHDNIRSVGDVESRGVELGALRHLRTLLMRFYDDANPDPTFTAFQLKLLNNEVMNTHIWLSTMSTAAPGGGSGMPDRLAYLLGWIGTKQDSENSVLSCFRS